LNAVPTDDVKIFVKHYDTAFPENFLIEAKGKFNDDDTIYCNPSMTCRDLTIVGSRLSSSSELDAFS
jgi:hypothetical protein